MPASMVGPVPRPTRPASAVKPIAQTAGPLEFDGASQRRWDPVPGCLHDIALATGSAPSTILRLTAQNSPRGMFPTDLADHVNGVFEMSTLNMDEGLMWEHDVPGSTEIETWTTGQHSSESLAALATRRHTTPARTLQLTAEHPPSKMFPRLVALYINQVFTDDPAPMPSGITLYYPGS